MTKVPEGVFPRFLSNRGLDIRKPTIENQAGEVAKDVAAYLAAGGSITVVPRGVSGVIDERGKYTGDTGTWPRPVNPEKAPKQKPVKKRRKGTKRTRQWISHGEARDPIQCARCGELAPWSSYRRVTGKDAGNVVQSAFANCKPCRDIERGAKKCRA